MESTLGQKRVNVNFNPSKDSIVDDIKNKGAEIIDLLQKLLKEDSSEERMRLIEIAQTKIETGCMYGVKANFKD